MPANISLDAIGVSGSKIVMDAPKLQGYKKDSRPYEMKAQSAAQYIKTPHIIELTKLDAPLRWAPTAQPSSPPRRCVRQQKGNDCATGRCAGGDQYGYDIRLKSADVEFKTRHVVSNQPVEVTMKSGTIR